MCCRNDDEQLVNYHHEHHIDDRSNAFDYRDDGVDDDLLDYRHVVVYDDVDARAHLSERVSRDTGARNPPRARA